MGKEGLDLNSLDPKVMLAKAAIKSLMPMIRKTIENADQFVEKTLIESPLEEGEKEAVYMLKMGVDGVAYMITAALNDDDQVVRMINQVKLTDFIEGLISKI